MANLWREDAPRVAGEIATAHRITVLDPVWARADPLWHTLRNALTTDR